MTLELERLWALEGFQPNPQQRKAILHTDGPLLLTAGPGSGKTRVLLWRTVNLIVCHGVPPEEIFLGTFTEKAALQLRQGLTAYLAEASRLDGRAYDLSRMPLGTVHSICRRILADRRFSRGRTRPPNLRLLDELEQYFSLLDHWDELLEEAGFDTAGNATINRFLTGRQLVSRHGAIGAVVSLFNRFSEECLDPEKAAAKAADPTLKKLLRMYRSYRDLTLTDLSLLQQAALEHCRGGHDTGRILRHVIVDEYQDTNHVQESLFFHLAAGHRNLCVVGDDDQSLYRFRGSTVENLVEFEQRCARNLGTTPARVDLGTNYRSKQEIVDFCSEFIRLIDWRNGAGSYRIAKQITPASPDDFPAIVASTPATPDDVCAEVAGLVRRLIDSGKVSDPNQIAILYPSLKSDQVKRMIAALEAQQLQVYAPRAGQFLEVPEAIDLLGVYLVLFGSPQGAGGNPGMRQFVDWLTRATARGREIVRGDRELAAFVRAKHTQIAHAMADRDRFIAAVGEDHLDEPAGEPVLRKLQAVRDVSPEATAYLRRRARRLVDMRRRLNRPMTVGDLINRVTTLDWGVLDLFYQLMQFDHFRRGFALADQGGDEGPVCNLAMVTRYLARFQSRSGAVLSARFLADGRFTRTFFNQFLYALWRRGESEYEDAEDPFPKGRIPFLTVHQAKGLEFPVVVLGNPRKQETVQRVEEIVRPLLEHRQGEPLHRIGEFDVARMFYVALSRPQNLLVVCHYQGRGQQTNEPFRTLLDDFFPRIPSLDLAAVASATPKPDAELPKTYSYTGDYLAFRACPRRYMIYRHLGFAPSRAQTMFFGSLVHRTVEDLHQWLRAQTEAGRRVS